MFRGMKSKVRTFYLCLKCIPTGHNPYADRLDCAFASFWIVGNDPERALRRARHFLSPSRWRSVQVACPPAETVREHYDKSELLEYFLEAQHHGIALCIEATARQGGMDRTETGAGQS